MKPKSTSKHNKLRNSNFRNKQTNNKLYMLPLIFIIGILPFIMRLHTYNTGLSGFTWYSSQDSSSDIFLYYKQIFFIFTCSVMTILAIFKIYIAKNKINFLPIFIPLLVYSILALLSTIFSDYSSFGFNGIFEQFESVFMLLGYCLVVYYAFLFINTEDDVKLIIRFLIISVLIIGILGTTQILGHDFFTTDLGKKLFIPSEYWNQLDSVNFNFAPKTVYLTLYNPNYVGVYVALISPIIICLMLITKNLKLNLLYLIALAGLLISLIGSKSDAGTIGITVSLLFIIILLRKYLVNKLKFILPAIIICLVVFNFLIPLDFSHIGSLISLLKPHKVEYNLTDIKTEDNIIVTYKGNDLIVNYTGTLATGIAVSIKDSHNQDIAYTINAENGSYNITDERFNDIIIYPTNYKNSPCINIRIDGSGTDWIFTNQLGDGTYYYMNNYGKPDKIVTADSSIFTGYERFASGRGYIWSRTIPLLKDYFLLGSGADTFAIVYPQQDYVYLSNADYANSLITKPHNLYLQTGVQTGVLSLIALLVFYGMYFCSSIYLYINGRFDNFFSQAGVAIFIGTISYMVVGISNDSSVTVAPVFWALVGVGIACNYKVKSMRKEENIKLL